MANQFKLPATINPANTAVEASTDNGVTWRAVAMSTVGSQQEGLLINVAAGTYAGGTVQLRSVAFPSVVASEPLARTVAGAAYTRTLLIPAGGAAQSSDGVTLSGPAGAKLEFNFKAGAGALPVHLDLLVGGTAVAGLDFEGNYIPDQFRFTTAPGTVYSGPGNTFQDTPTGLTLS